MNFELRNELTGRTLERNFKYFGKTNNTIRTSRETYRLSHKKKKTIPRVSDSCKRNIMYKIDLFKVTKQPITGPSML